MEEGTAVVVIVQTELLLLGKFINLKRPLERLTDDGPPRALPFVYAN